jgi:hypothetical protein
MRRIDIRASGALVLGCGKMIGMQGAVFACEPFGRATMQIAPL